MPARDLETKIYELLITAMMTEKVVICIATSCKAPARLCHDRAFPELTEKEEAMLRRTRLNLTTAASANYEADFGADMSYLPDGFESSNAVTQKTASSVEHEVSYVRWREDRNLP